MSTITSDRVMARLVTTSKICSAKWRRRTDKSVNRCVNCETETASHKGEQFCKACNCNVTTYKSKEARKGDIIQMQFIPKIAANRLHAMKSKNFTGVGRNIFNAPTFAEGQEILRKTGNIQVWKMGEQVPTDNADDLRAMIATGDLQGVPRCLPVGDLVEITFDGETHEIA